MTKEQRQHAGYPRLTAYCVAHAMNPKLTTAFLKREHGVKPRGVRRCYLRSEGLQFSRLIASDYMPKRYQLPLLPGYVPSVNVRTSVVTGGDSEDVIGLTEAEELGYEGTYFSEGEASASYTENNGFLASSPNTLPVGGDGDDPFSPSDIAPSTPPAEPPVKARRAPRPKREREDSSSPNVAEVIVFTYGVVVFFGLTEALERADIGRP